jgi:hypothetical protein
VAASIPGRDIAGNAVPDAPTEREHLHPVSARPQHDFRDHYRQRNEHGVGRTPCEIKQRAHDAALQSRRSHRIVSLPAEKADRDIDDSPGHLGSLS